jgi:hypothetical protein
VVLVKLTGEKMKNETETWSPKQIDEDDAAYFCDQMSHWNTNLVHARTDRQRQFCRNIISRALNEHAHCFKQNGPNEK